MDSLQPKSAPATPDSSGNGASSHKRTTSGTGLLSKLSFMRPSPDKTSRLAVDGYDDREDTTSIDPPLVPKTNAQQKTRRRKGSLRKVALLGRGAQRERRESSSMSIDTRPPTVTHGGADGLRTSPPSSPSENSLGLGIADVTPRPSMEGYTSRKAEEYQRDAVESSGGSDSISRINYPVPTVEVDEPTPASPTMSYNTTDDEDVLQMGEHTVGSPGGGSSPVTARVDGPTIPAGNSESFFNHMDSIQRRRSNTIKKSPLSLSGLAVTSAPIEDQEWDYSETEWWGWVILILTWLVFVVGMGSCFDIWEWSWDVGSTPSAPPELEDDPTLPIVGYYPALLVLTCVVAWVWCLVAWVGMKYFRHAKIE